MICFGIVLLDPTVSNQYLETCRLLAPYDAARPTLPVRCFCVGLSAHRDAFEAAEAFKPSRELRREVGRIKAETLGVPGLRDKITMSSMAERYRMSIQIRQHVFADWNKIYEETRELHPGLERADLNCPACAGVGRYEVSYRQRLWDDWQVGGAFNGLIRDAKSHFYGESIEENSLPVTELMSSPRIYAAAAAIISSDGNWHTAEDEPTARRVLQSDELRIAVGCAIHLAEPGETMTKYETLQRA